MTGMLQSMGLQRVGHDWVTEQQYKSLPIDNPFKKYSLNYIVYYKSIHFMVQMINNNLGKNTEW